MTAEWLTAEWLAAAEMAALLGLNRRSFDRLAAERCWTEPENFHCDANPRGTWKTKTGPGGGALYHYGLLPVTVQLKWLAQREAEASSDVPAQPQQAPSEAWARYDALSGARKAAATERLKALDAVEVLIRGGAAVELAVTLVAHQDGIGKSSLYLWRTRVAGRERADWLPYLADYYAGRTATAAMAPEAWAYFKADYLTLSRPALSASYARTKEVGDAQGWTVPAESAFRRRLQREVPAQVLVLQRDGREAADRLYPAQRRDRGDLYALQAVDWDGHQFDVFVAWPGLKQPVRPVISVFQDLYSGKLLSWRLDVSENTTAFRLAFGDLIEAWGIPEIAVIDNTRTAANKQMTGGTPTRFRFKVKAEDPAGLFTILGVEVHWTTPYHGQSKPIERAFKDLCETIAKSPDCVGAYTGNSPTTKPENHGARAMPLADFIKVVEREIRRHNARPNRKTGVCGGVKSFDQAFADSYATAPIRKPRPEHRRLWLLPAEGVTGRKPDGRIELMGNRYWSPELVELIGRKLVVRFDPDDLHQPVHVYRLCGAYVGPAECIRDTGFFDLDAAKTHAQARGAFRKKTRELAAAEVSLSAAEAAALRPAIAAPVPVEARVVRLDFATRGNAALKPAPAAAAPDLEVEFDTAAAFARGIQLVVDNQ
ncbi:MAG: transposase [Candidatus Hydrogenedens sp.]|nr:transposase [Candidatus Hydrogenedens sp.]